MSTATALLVTEPDSSKASVTTAFAQAVECAHWLNRTFKSAKQPYQAVIVSHPDQTPVRIGFCDAAAKPTHDVISCGESEHAAFSIAQSSHISQAFTRLGFTTRQVETWDELTFNADPTCREIILHDHNAIVQGLTPELITAKGADLAMWLRNIPKF